MIIGHIRHCCYTAEVQSLSTERVSGILHRHVLTDPVEPYRQRPFDVKIKEGKFKVTTNGGRSGSISEYFNIKDMVK